MRYTVYKCACLCIRVSLCLCLISLSLVSLSGMALGFFNLGPRTHMSGQIGVPSIFGGCQNLGDLPLRNSFCCCYEKEWLAKYCHTVNKASLSFLLFENINFRQYNALTRSLLWLLKVMLWRTLKGITELIMIGLPLLGPACLHGGEG